MLNWPDSNWLDFYAKYPACIIFNRPDLTQIDSKLRRAYFVLPEKQYK